MPLLVHGLQHQCILLHCFCPIWCVNKDYCWCTKYLSLFAIRITLRNPVITFHLPLPIRAFCRRTHIVYLICITCAKKKNCLQRKGRIRYRNYLRFSQWCSTYHPVFYIIIFTDIYVVPPVSLNILLFIKPHGTKVEYVSFVWIFMRHNLNVCLYVLVIFHKL